VKRHPFFYSSGSNPSQPSYSAGSPSQPGNSKKASIPTPLGRNFDKSRFDLCSEYVISYHWWFIYSFFVSSAPAALKKPAEEPAAASSSVASLASSIADDADFPDDGFNNW
jgi:hypothetical protein